MDERQYKVLAQAYSVYGKLSVPFIMRKLRTSPEASEKYLKEFMNKILAENEQFNVI